MRITFYGHSCLGIQIDDAHLLIDPFIRQNPQASHIDMDAIRADYILVTHAHYDHTLDLEFFAEKTGATLISNFEIVNHYAQKGIKGHPMGVGGSWEFPFGTLKMVPASHSSSFLDGSYGGTAAGFILSGPLSTIYISGDTSLTAEMKLIPEFFQIDLAVFPIGGNFTMDVSEAIIASDFIKCNRVLAVHFDTSELIRIDQARSIGEFSKRDKELLILPIGGSLELD